MKEKRLLIFIPDGTGIKNYLFSDFLKLASDNFNIILAHNFNKSIHSEINISKNKFQHVKIPEYKESFKHKFIRESLCFSRLKHNAKLKANQSIMSNWFRKYNNLTKRIFYRIVEAYGLFLGKKYCRIKKLTEYYHQNLLQSSTIYRYSKLLEETKPDLVFTTHQRALHNIPLFAAAKKMNITSVSVIYSWDNMPKARIPYFSDYFFVWSKYMKKEFDDYYPEIPTTKIKICGTPQFEFYGNDTLIESKVDFFNRHKLHLDRPLICYSGDDKLTSPFDADYLRDMAISFSKMEQRKRPQIILRPSPTDDGSRYQDVLKQFPEICYAPADWFQIDDKAHWAVKFPKKNDIKQLVNLAYHADAVVNLGSTMAHDFAMFEKPAFYVNYMPKASEETLKSPYAKNWSVNTIYQFQHFKSMGQLNPVHWINNKKDFDHILEKIDKVDPNIKRDQKLWRDKVIGEDLFKNASQNLVQELLNLA